jgi:hypothetical protein
VLKKGKENVLKIGVFHWRERERERERGRERVSHLY